MIDRRIVRPDFVHLVDLSGWQTRVDYEALGRGGVVGGWVKVSEGGSGGARLREEHTHGLVRALLLQAGYHFARPDLNPRAPEREARNFLVGCGELPPPTLCPVLDLERGGELGRDRLTGWTVDWLGAVEDVIGCWPLLYCGRLLKRLDLARLPDGVAHWVPHYPAVDGAPLELHVALRDARLQAGTGPRRPAGVEWACWQWTSRGRIHGVRGNVDLNVARELRPLLAPHPISA